MLIGSVIMLQVIPNLLKIEKFVTSHDEKTILCCLNSDKEPIDVNNIKNKNVRNKFKIIPKLDSGKI